MQLRHILDKYFTHDARELASLLPTGDPCIDVTITSPPYWNVKDYGYKKQIGFGQSYDQYLSDLDKVFGAVYAATRSTGSLWLITDTFKEDGELRLLPFDIASRLRSAGWLLQDIIIWQKDRTLPWSHQGKLRNIFEYIACYTKTRRFTYHLQGVRDIVDVKDYWIRYPERYSPGGKTPTRSWSIPIPRQGAWGKAANYVRHSCPLPAELVERILRLTTSPGDVVLDPFAGSGAVLASAKAMKRKYIGLDLNRSYRTMFHEEVLPTVLKQHSARRRGDAAKQTTQKRFATAILALRCLKFPKELIRLFKAKFKHLSTSAVLVVPDRTRRNLSLVFCFPSGRAVPKLFLQRARDLARLRPLSKYGIRVHIHAVNSSSDLRRFLTKTEVRPRRLAVYTNGRFYSRATFLPTRARNSLASLFERSTKQSSYPRILSTLDLSLQPDDPGLFFAPITDG